jgi:putative tricarboxylic transport membrane protein
MMEVVGHLTLGLSVALAPLSLLYLTIGVLVGIVVGIVPGIGPAAGISILLPLTLSVPPVTAIVMLAGIYYGSQYGGTITGILLNTPGESSAVPATFDGYPLAKQGRAGPALVMQAVASFIGGTSGVVLLTFLAAAFAAVTKTFGPPEFFMLVMLGMMTLASMLGAHLRYGVIAALLGFALATVGIDIGSGEPRFTFGSAELLSGIDFVPIAIGLFGVGEVFNAVYGGDHARVSGVADVRFGRDFWPSTKDWSESKGAFVRGSVLGFFIGLIPGAGATVASLFSYAVEKSVSKEPERFGKGAMAGLVAPEAANNAASTGAMVPLIALGLPGSAATAVLLGAFLMWGLQPGPLLIEENPEFVWGLIASMYIGNVILVAVCIFAIPLFMALLRIPYRIMAPLIIVLCTVGTYSINRSILETGMMLTAGWVGFFMRRCGMPPAALVVALVLGPLAENTLQQSLAISGGSFLIFVQRPVSLTIGVLCLLILAGGGLAKRAAMRSRVLQAAEPLPVAPTRTGPNSS